MSEAVAPLSEETKAAIRAIDLDWAYNTCCGEPFNCGGCYVDKLTGA